MCGSRAAGSYGSVGKVKDMIAATAAAEHFTASLAGYVLADNSWSDSGVDPDMQVLVLAVQNSVEHRDLGTATSANSFFRSMGGAFGVAIFGSIFNNRLTAYLSDLLPPGFHLDPTAVQGGPEALRALRPDIRAVVVDAFAQALHVAFLWGIPFAVLGFIVVIFLREEPLKESAHAWTHRLDATSTLWAVQANHQARTG